MIRMLIGLPPLATAPTATALRSLMRQGQLYCGTGLMFENADMPYVKAHPLYRDRRHAPLPASWQEPMDAPGRARASAPL